MKWWKYILSYLTPLRLEALRGQYGMPLFLDIHRGQLQLSTPNAIYSYGLRYRNFAQLFELFQWEKLHLQHALILGMGLCSIPILLEKRHGRQLRYTAIEYDQAVIDLASRWVLPHLQSPIDVIHADAYHWIRATEQRYGLICMDIFVDDRIPDKFLRKEYLLQLRRILQPHGLLVFNTLYRDEASQQHTKRFFNEIFKDVFPRGQMRIVHRNALLLSRPLPL